jgi:hypothetical protein
VLVSDRLVSEEATVARNVVIGEHMGDPAGYSIAYDEERWYVVIRVTDGVWIGRFASRTLAIAAAESDRVRPPA